MFDFHAWIVENNLEAYEETLKAQDIDTKDMLVSLSEGDLSTMGITSLGGQKKIMNAVQKLKSSAGSHALRKMMPYVITALILLSMGISIAIAVYNNISTEVSMSLGDIPLSTPENVIRFNWDAETSDTDKQDGNTQKTVEEFIEEWLEENREELVIKKTSIMAVNMKYYSDLSNGYSGEAGAKYFGTTKTLDPSFLDSKEYFPKRVEQAGFIVTRHLEKLSKAENFLIWKALDEYNVEDGELYNVTVKCANSEEFLSLYAEICDNGKGFYRYGGLYAIKQ